VTGASDKNTGSGKRMLFVGLHEIRCQV
jgi:hypothetical protein